MKTDTVLPEEQLIRQAMTALIDQLGISETTRFLALQQPGRIDAVERHRQWQETLNKDDFFTQVFPPE